MTIQIFNECKLKKVPRNVLIAIVRRIYQEEHIPTGRQTNLILCDECAIQSLNFQYRQKDSVTDVLSFPFNDPDLLGEIYICVSRANSQANEYGFTLTQELTRLLVHGMIHLLGHDHHTVTQQRKMEAIERKYFLI